MNILIVKLSAIGDVVHTLPSLSALRKHYPGAHIDWVVEEAAADLVRGHPYLDRVIVSRRRQWVKQLKRGAFGQPGREARALVGDIRRRPYDLVIDFHGLLKSAVIVWLSRGRRKIGYDSMQEFSSLPLTEKIPEDMTKHAVDRYLDFARYLGADATPVEFLVPVAGENTDRVDALLQDNGIAKEDVFIAVNPTALWQTKLWEDEKFAGLSDRLVSETGMKIVFTDSVPDNINRIQSLMRRESVNLGGRTTLKDLACLYRRASFLVTTDSGPMHLAAAMGTRVCALFGPTDPSRTGPYGNNHIVVRKQMACSPCFKKTCRHLGCMREISVENVLGQIKRNFLQEKGERSL